MTIDYDLIRSFHAVDAILNNEETARRLREAAYTNYTHDPRCKAISAIVSKKPGLSQTELATLRDFPTQGINIGLYSNALLFAPALRLLPPMTHKAIVSLMKQGKLAIVEGYRIDINPRSRMEQIIVKVEG